MGPEHGHHHDEKLSIHHYDVIIDAMRSQIISLAIVYSVVYSDADQRKHQSSASLAFVRGIHRGPVNSPHTGPVTRKCFHFMTSCWFIHLISIHSPPDLSDTTGLRFTITCQRKMKSRCLDPYRLFLRSLWRWLECEWGKFMDVLAYLLNPRV